MPRSAALQDLLDAAATACREVARGDSARVTETVFARATRDGTQPHRVPPIGLPACDWLAPALAAAARGPHGGVARAFATLAPQLAWTRRAGTTPNGGAFWDGHANAVLCGPAGYEPRDDILIGATIMAPGVQYPEHDHPPEEVYLPLSQGEWWNSARGWMDPQGLSLICNPPGIRHSMRAPAAAPLLALWFLPLGG